VSTRSAEDRTAETVTLAQLGEPERFVVSRASGDDFSVAVRDSRAVSDHDSAGDQLCGQTETGISRPWRAVKDHSVGDEVRIRVVGFERLRRDQAHVSLDIDLGSRGALTLQDCLLAGPDRTGRYKLYGPARHTPNGTRVVLVAFRGALQDELRSLGVQASDDCYGPIEDGEE